jgi:hypothetical protein
MIQSIRPVISEYICFGSVTPKSVRLALLDPSEVGFGNQLSVIPGRLGPKIEVVAVSQISTERLCAVPWRVEVRFRAGK